MRSRSGSAASKLASDPELQVRRPADEPVIGFGAFALVDNLTLLYSRRYLHELARSEAQRAAVQGRPFAVVLAELTDLDRINREDGYAAGDDAIRAVARAAEKLAADAGGTACRCSGRRVAVLFSGADEEAGEALARELERELGGDPRIVTKIAAWQPDDDGDDVIDRARQRLVAEA